MENPYAFPFYWNPPFNAIIGVFWLALNMEILLIDWSQLLKYSVNVPSLSHIKRVCKKFTEKKEIFSGTKNPDCDKINKWCVYWVIPHDQKILVINLYRVGTLSNIVTSRGCVAGVRGSPLHWQLSHQSSQAPSLWRRDVRVWPAGRGGHKGHFCHQGKHQQSKIHKHWTIIAINGDVLIPHNILIHLLT